MSVEKVSGVIAAGTLYFGAITVAYQEAYWLGFDINGLNFFPLADAVKWALWPVVLCVSVSLLGVIVSELVGRGWLRRASADTRADGDEIDGRQALITLAAIVLFAAAITALSPQLRYFIWWMVAGSAALGALVWRRSFREWFSSRSAWVGTLYALVFLPCGVVGLGIRERHLVADGLKYQRAEIPLNIRMRAGISPGAELRFLATAGEHTLFLVEAGPAIAVLANDEVKSIVLHPVEERSQMDSLVERLRDHFRGAGPSSISKRD